MTEPTPELAVPGIDPADADKYVTMDQAAELCGVKRRTVDQWLRDGKLTKFRAHNGYHVRINKLELQSFNYARNQKNGPRVPASRE